MSKDQSKRGEPEQPAGALRLTAELRVDRPRAESSGALSDASLSNLHTALSSSEDKPSGEAIVENLRETWVAPKPDEYYEDETDDAPNISFSHDGELPEVSARDSVEDPFDIELEEQQQPQDDLPATFEFTPVVTPREPEENAEESLLDAYLAQKSAEEEAKAKAESTDDTSGHDKSDADKDAPAEKEKEPSIRDTIRSELKAVRTPIAPTPEGAEPVTIPRFRHRGWSYDLASAAGWNTEPAGADDATTSDEPDAPTTGTVYIGPTGKSDAKADEVESEAKEAEESSVVPFNPKGGAIDASMIDEDMLREVVADILREELSGALGERITRNVRKLVRREIHRAMMTQDYD